MRSARSCALARAGRAGRNGIMIAAGRKAVSREAEEQKPDRQKWEGRVETARGDMDGKRLDGGNSADRIRQNLTAKRGRSIVIRIISGSRISLRPKAEAEERKSTGILISPRLSATP